MDHVTLLVVLEIKDNYENALARVDSVGSIDDLFIILFNGV